MKKVLQIILPVLVLIYVVWMVIFIAFQFRNGVNGTEDNGNPVINVPEIDVNEVVRNELIKKIKTVISEEDGMFSVYVKNLDTGMELEINNRKIRAAGLIKLFNMVALYNEADNQNIMLDDYAMKNLKQMIIEDSDSNSNKVVTTIGGGSFDDGAKIVTELVAEYGCVNTVESQMLYNTYVPATNGTNTTSVKDCGLILEKIYKGECVNTKYDKEMLDLLKLTDRNTKLSVRLPEGTEIAHKTAESNQVEADVGIVFSPACDYVICVSVTEFGTEKPEDNISDISECVYNFFNNITE